MLLTAAERAIENPESAEEIPLSEKTGFAKAIRLHPAVFSFGSFVCRVPKDDLVEFYQLIPLFEEESDLIDMAIYLYWSIQHDLMSNPFNHKIGMDRYMPTVQAVLGREAFPQAGPSALNPLRIMEVGKAVGSLLWGTK